MRLNSTRFSKLCFELDLILNQMKKKASEGQILEPPICPPSIFSRNIAFPKLRKARFWHRPSVHPYFSQLISHFPGFGKLDFGTAHLSTPTFLLKDHIFQASESQILAPPICPPPLFSRNIAFSKLRKARFWHRPSVHPHFSR